MIVLIWVRIWNKSHPLQKTKAHFGEICFRATCGPDGAFEQIRGSPLGGHGPDIRDALEESGAGYSSASTQLCDFTEHSLYICTTLCVDSAGYLG